MIGGLIKTIHTTTLRMRKWGVDETELLIAKVQEFGPAWTVCSQFLPGRSALDCRKQHGTISSKDKNGEEKMLMKQGCEKFPDSAPHQWFIVPLEPCPKNSFENLASKIPPQKFRSEKKKLGWSNEEILALREGFELYGPDWTKISRKLQYRTPKQCQKILEKLSIHTNKL